MTSDLCDESDFDTLGLKRRYETMPGAVRCALQPKGRNAVANTRSGRRF